MGHEQKYRFLSFHNIFFWGWGVMELITSRLFWLVNVWLHSRKSLWTILSVCHPLHEEIALLLEPEKFPGWWWWWDLPIIESISRSRPWDLRMTKSIFRPCTLLELTWTWSGPWAWQYVIALHSIIFFQLRRFLMMP